MTDNVRISMRERRTHRRGHALRLAVIVAVVMTCASSAAGQEAESPPLTLSDVVDLAVKNHPALRESRARAAAATEGVSVARTAYLPHLDLLWQLNRATRNNVFGLLLPQAIVPPISGPVLEAASSNSVWSTAAGVLLSWDAVDFGQRKASVEAARAQGAAAQARAELSELDTAAAAADAFLAVLAADEAVRASQANVARLQVFADAVRTLVENQLRPGADQSRAEAELALARNQLSQAVQVAEIARASLAEATGAAGTGVNLVPGRVGQLPEIPAAEVTNVQTHPAARAGLAAVDAVRARARALDRSTLPRVALQSAFAARGAGEPLPGQLASGDGLWPRVSNWAAGVSLTFPLTNVFTVAPQKRMEMQNESAERARYDQTVQQLTAQEARVRALTTAAVEIARNSPIGLRAATDAESRARARYDNGLASITEVAEAQRLLAQAEADTALARLGVWRALLAAAQVRGDLTPFLERTRP
jgi:outer membrane protein